MDRIAQLHAFKASCPVHCNCCQSVLLAFLPECGIDEDTAMTMGAHFGGGMRRGSVCRAVSGAMMVLGLTRQDETAANQFLSHFQTAHGELHCAQLLAKSKPASQAERRAHCDGLIDDAVGWIDQLLQQTKEE